MNNERLTNEQLRRMTRRHFFRQSGFGIGALALASLLDEKLLSPSAQAATKTKAAAESMVPGAVQIDLAHPMLPRAPHFAPKAKNIIYLFMAGAPSQIDLFDAKPKLVELDGQHIPEEIIKGERFAFIKGVPKLLGSPHQFHRHGQSGQEISDLLPHLGKVADDIAIVRSMQTSQFNHAPAQIFMNSGHQVIGRPSMGAWLTYGLGSESRDLPGFLVLLSGENRPDGGTSSWCSGFLPTVFQGVELRSQGEPVLFAGNPEGLSSVVRRQQLDALKDLNLNHMEELGDPEIATRIASYEMAYRMSTLR